MPKATTAKSEALKRLETLRVRSYGFTWLERAVTVTSLLVFFGTVIDVALGEAVWAVISVTWVCLLATGAVILVLVQERRARRRLAYAQALTHLHSVFHLKRDAEAAILQRNVDIDDTLPVLQRVMTATAEAFTVITGARCRASIKQVVYPDAGMAVPIENATGLRQLQVYTLVRDEATGPRDHDRTPVYVDQNTDFELLFLQRDAYPWFMSNDLSSLDAYKNSSWTEDGPRDYLATCVWPIQKVDPKGVEHDTLGFLCVDTLERESFDRHFDFFFGAAIADGLYPLLKLMLLQKLGVTFDQPGDE